MIKIICDEEKDLGSVKNMKAIGFRGVLEFQGDREVVEHQLATVLLQLMRSAPELLENSLNRAEEYLHDENN